LRARAVQHPCLELFAGDVTVSGTVASNCTAVRTAVARSQPDLVTVLERVGELLGVATHRHVLILVRDGSVEQDVVDRRAVGVAVDLADQQLDL
jgi:hypothetical protein